MSNRPTPRTDEFLNDPSNGFQSLEYFARRLERELAEANEHRDALSYEVRVLRLYGNKDCTAMADAALAAVKGAEP